MTNMTQNRLSANFTLAELCFSATARRHGIDNRPGQQEIIELTRLVENILEPVRQNFAVPFRPSSGYRSPELNLLLGSAPGSQHITGHAADFEIPGIANRALGDWIRDNLRFDQLILEFHHPDVPQSGWVHCSYDSDNNRQQSLIFDGRNYKEF